MGRFTHFLVGLALVACFGASGCGGDDSNTAAKPTTDVNSCFYKCGGSSTCMGATAQTDAECRAQAETDCGTAAIEQYVFMKGCECSSEDGTACTEPSWY
jgi:hypothetical protein